MTGTDVKNARLQAGWTRMAVARKLGVIQAYLSMVESGSRAVSDALCHDSMTNAEQTWLREHRSQEAAYWNLLTDLRADQLVHVTI